MTTHSLHTKPRVAACALRVQVTDNKTRLMPAGTFHAPRGAAEGTGPWHLSAEAAQAIIRLAAAPSTDIAIDYEHQILYSEKNGQPAPASGWVDPRSLEYREDGLYGKVAWTAKARAAIEPGPNGEPPEYRYLSPVFPYDANGVPLDLLHLALTNTPAIDEGAAMIAAARMAIAHDVTDAQENDTVDREQLIAQLGLATDATDEQIKTAIAALKSAQADADAYRKALGAKDGTKPEEAVAALKASSAAAPVDMSQYVPKAAHDEVLAVLRTGAAANEQAEMDRLIQQGIDEGKISGPHYVAHLRAQGLAALKSYMEDAPVIAALKAGQTQTQGKQPKEDQGKEELTEAQLAVCKAMGLTPEQYQAAKVEGQS